MEIRENLLEAPKGNVEAIGNRFGMTSDPWLVSANGLRGMTLHFLSIVCVFFSISVYLHIHFLLPGSFRCKQSCKDFSSSNIF